MLEVQFQLRFVPQAKCQELNGVPDAGKTWQNTTVRVGSAVHSMPHHIFGYDNIDKFFLLSGPQTFRTWTDQAKDAFLLDKSSAIII